LVSDIPAGNGKNENIFNYNVEDQVFLRRMIQLLAHPLPPFLHLSSEQVVSLSQSFRVLPVELTDGGGRGGRGAKSHDLEKAWPTINHSILSDPTSLKMKKGEGGHWFLPLANMSVEADGGVGGGHQVSTSTSYQVHEHLKLDIQVK
jgi:hypothetical protein